MIDRLAKPLAALTAAAGLAVAAPAVAADAGEGPAFSFNLGASTDYVFRGVSQTDEDPQVFGGVDFGDDRFYLGAWVSNVDFGDSTDAEFDLYAGFTPQVGAISMDLGVYYYGYIDAPSGSDSDYFEFKVAGSIPLGPATLGGAVWYSPNSYGGVDNATYFEVNGSYSIGEKLSLSAALGRQLFDGPGDYTTWNAGIGYALTDNIGVDLRYHDTNRHRFGKLYDSRVTLGLSVGF
ncbi:TorF family putative porin [Phenylobacterium sp. SCN 70-31]|uniref:TorF family putative porin n=1 Tax=Phenylobacterium sp. SCN 70-31 TaxID=1660129 RepID=UPI00086BFEBD|nr:TorF family putative porin [Phenylobacterium sp. SCN 70-31]ODT89382.1 MAG: hypothetical protein ABS78_04160 [Phenylobacterium sp. SCN 70-31]